VHPKARLYCSRWVRIWRLQIFKSRFITCRFQKDPVSFLIFYFYARIFVKFQNVPDSCVENSETQFDLLSGL